jgi:Flp pilus assembly protein protease CpaA
MIFTTTIVLNVLILFYLIVISISDIKTREVNDAWHLIPLAAFIFKVTTELNPYLFILPIIIGIVFGIIYKLRLIGGADVLALIGIAAVLQFEFITFLLYLAFFAIFWTIIWTLWTHKNYTGQNPFIIYKNPIEVVEGDTILYRCNKELKDKKVYVDKHLLKQIHDGLIDPKMCTFENIDSVNSKKFVILDGIPLMPVILFAFIVVII